MPLTLSTPLELDIPQTPETVDPELFKELLRVYNSLQLIAQALGDIQAATVIPAAAVDPATTMALVNAIRTVLIAAKITA
jgi:hypothetical protein